MSEKEKLPWGLKQIAPGSIKSLSKDKLEAFDQGTMNTFVKKHLSKKEQEELRKKQEDEAAKEVLHDFVASFDNSAKTMPKMFIKGAVINPSTKEEKPITDQGLLYKPALKLIGKTSGSNSVSNSPVSSNTKQLLNTSLSSLDSAKSNSELERLAKKKQSEEKKKSNLELFKEELKRMQMEREERQKKRQNTKTTDDNVENKELNRPQKTSEKSDLSDLKQNAESNLDQESSQDSNTGGSVAGKPNSVEDPSTTNIFISNLSPKTNEQDLIKRFGKYGLLASVKIMWPRSEEEKARNANCGFVAFMSRRDAEIALKELDGCLENSQTMRLSWSKAITLPSQPVYIPPDLIDIIIPPPPSGLPFNAQPQEPAKIKQIKKKILKKKRQARKRSTSSSRSRSYSSSSSSRSSSSSSSSTSRSSSAESSKRQEKNNGQSSNDFHKTLENSLVKVVIPTDRALLCLIHRMIEFVVREGPALEAIIMTKEANNPQYRFLFDNQSPAHSYYRWKLFSIIHGESYAKWQTNPFRMFKNGSFWQPPPLNRYTQGSPDESYEKVKYEMELRKGSLSNDKRDKLEDMLRNLTTERKSIGEAMIFCIENAEKAEEIIQCIVESLTLEETPLNKKIARLYLISDILHNCCVKVANASYYRSGFEKYLLNVFEHVSQTWINIDGKMKSESFKQKVLSCVRAWNDWAIYPNEYLVKLQNMFLGLVSNKFKEEKKNSDYKKENSTTDEDESDVDGKPLEEDEEHNENESLQDTKSSLNAPKFVSSKWETVDPEKLEKQAVTTSKWDFFEESQSNNLSDSLKMLNSYDTEEDDDENSSSENKINKNEIDEKNNGIDDDDDEDIDGKPMEDDEITESKPKDFIIDEEKRKFLREIEVRILKYIDDIENGNIARDLSMSIQEQSEQYRAHLIKEAKEANLENNETKPAVQPTRSSSSSSSSSSRSQSHHNSRSKNEKKKKRNKSKSPYSKTNRSSYSSNSGRSSENRKKQRI